MIRAIRSWLHHVPDGYVTSNGFWVAVLLVLLSPLIVLAPLALLAGALT